MEPPTAHPDDAPAAGESAPRPLLRSLRFWIPAAVCLIAVVAVPVAFIIGAVLGSVQIYRNFSEHQQARIEDYLSQHPDAFSEISVEQASSGWAFPVGAVSSQDDYDSLNSKLHEMFGDELAEQMMYTIDVEAD